MAIQIKTRYLILGLILALLSLFLLGWGLGSSKQKKSLSGLVNGLKYEITRSKIEIDKKTIYLAKTQQELTTERELRKADIVDKETLRKLNLKQTNELTKAKLRIDTLLTQVSHSGQIITIHDTVTINNPKKAILLPFSFTRKDEWLQLDGTFNSQGKLDISLKMDVSVDVFTGVEKKTKEPICILSTANPYIKTIGLASYKTDPPKKKKYGIGLQVGYGINLIGDEIKPTPYIGVGVSCNFIRF